MADSQDTRARFDEALGYLDALYSTALRLCGGRRDQAEDVVQDTYVKAYRFFDGFQPGTNLKAWLYTILMNTYRNRLRRERRGPRSVDFDEVEPYYELVRSEDSPSSRTPEDDFFEYAGVERIAAAIEALPEPFREVIQLACVEQFLYKEICEMLDIPIGTVMSRIHRGRKLLQKALVEEARKAGVLKEKED